MNFCIPRGVMKSVVSKIKELDQKEPIQRLGSLTTKERLNLFKQVLSDESATRLNREFERAIASQKMNALQNWVVRNLDEKYRAEFDMKALQRKIKTLDDFNAYIEANAETYALRKNNVALTAKEMREFNRLGKDIFETQQKLGDNFGNIVEHFDDNLAYAKSVKAIQEYSQSLLPSSKIKVFTKSVGKAVMLASIKSPLLNIVANTSQGIYEAITRRIVNRSLGGKVPAKILKQYIKNVNVLFKQTGIDFSRMLTIDDPVAGVGKVLGEEISTPKNAYLRGFTDFIFNKTLSTPDVAFSSVHFADSANLLASRYGKNAADATAIFKDALRIEPKTTAGQIVRTSAIADAMYATFTNDSQTAKLNKGIRHLLGPAGDIMLPFVKTPSNVVESSLDYAGLGALKGVYKMQKAIRADGFSNVSREAWREIARDVTRAGLGFTSAFILAQTIDNSEFMGAYDPARNGINQLKNTTYNAIKIGNKWINVDYFGPLGAPLVSMMYSKKYGGENGMIQSYARGMVSQFTKAPGIEPLANTVNELLKVDPESGEGLNAGKIPQALLDQLSARLIPGLSYDLAKATDDVQRDTKRNKYLIKTPLVDLNLDPLVAKIPFLRKTLAPKHDALGRLMYEEDPVTSLLFGARVRTAKEDEITNEIFRLRDAGFKPNIREIRYSNSEAIKQLKEKEGEEKFYDIAVEFGASIAEAYEREMSKSSYQKLSDEEKKKRLDDAMEEEYKKMLAKHGIKLNTPKKK